MVLLQSAWLSSQSFTVKSTDRQRCIGLRYFQLQETSHFQVNFPTINNFFAESLSILWHFGSSALAWAIIPQSWSLTLFGGAFVYNSWRIFILVCSMPALIAFLGLLNFPESPKYLMSKGRNEEALKVFQKMYSMNTGNPPEMFPVIVQTISPNFINLILMNLIPFNFILIDKTSHHGRPAEEGGSLAWQEQLIHMAKDKRCVQQYTASFCETILRPVSSHHNSSIW